MASHSTISMGQVWTRYPQETPSLSQSSLVKNIVREISQYNPTMTLSVGLSPLPPKPCPHFLKAPVRRFQRSIPETWDTGLRVGSKGHLWAGNFNPSYCPGSPVSLSPKTRPLVSVGSLSDHLPGSSVALKSPMPVAQKLKPSS